MKENRTEETTVDEQTEQTGQNELTIKERKIDLTAKNSFEIYQLKQTSDHFLPCQIKEEIEFYEFTFTIENQQEISSISSKNWDIRLSALIQIQQILTQEKNYQFSMTPSNFYIDTQGIVRVLKRDLQLETIQPDQQLKQFQALAGALLQGKYSYEEIFNGGIDLLKENERTKSLLEWGTLEEAEKDLLEKQTSFRNFQQQTTKKVKKIPHLIMLIGLIVFSIATVVVSGFYIHQKFWVIPPQEQALAAERGFIEKDYVKVIESLEKMDLSKMAKPEKYILAVSYVRSQSIDTFSNEAKELILSKIVPTGTETVMDYWISLGRLDAKSATEIAMSLSDNQLLLYAYLQEMDNVSRDKELAGPEKAEKLNDLEGKIKGLADKLGIEYDEKKGTINNGDTENPGAPATNTETPKDEAKDETKESATNKENPTKKE